MEALLSERYLQSIFGQIFWSSPSWRRIPFQSFALGLQQVIESEGAILHNATAYALNNTFSQGRRATREKYVHLFRQQELHQYLSHLQREPLTESLRQAFSPPGHFPIKMAANYAPNFFVQSRVFYADPSRKEEFIRSHFRLKESIDNIHYFIPLFTLEGLL